MLIRNLFEMTKAYIAGYQHIEQEHFDLMINLDDAQKTSDIA